jgi:hypothetical protein
VKLRILGNSIRLRLTRSEVEAAAAGSAVEGRCVFGPDPANALTYTFLPDTKVTQLETSWGGGTLTVRAPISLVEQWNDSDLVGMERTWRQSDHEELTVLVEKDFSCLKPREGGDDLDTFPHPQST